MFTITQIAASHPEVGSEQTIRRAAHRGDLKAIRVGAQGIFLVTQDDLDDWLTAIAA